MCDINLDWLQYGDSQEFKGSSKSKTNKQHHTAVSKIMQHGQVAIQSTSPIHGNSVPCKSQIAELQRLITTTVERNFTR